MDNSTKPDKHNPDKPSQQPDNLELSKLTLPILFKLLVVNLTKQGVTRTILLALTLEVNRLLTQISEAILDLTQTHKLKLALLGLTILRVFLLALCLLLMTAIIKAVELSYKTLLQM